MQSTLGAALKFPGQRFVAHCSGPSEAAGSRLRSLPQARRALSALACFFSGLSARFSVCKILSLCGNHAGHRYAVPRISPRGPRLSPCTASSRFRLESSWGLRSRRSGQNLSRMQADSGESSEFCGQSFQGLIPLKCLRGVNSRLWPPMSRSRIRAAFASPWWAWVTWAPRMPLHCC